ncbi:hypothetical protein PAXINDRAFT_21433 [Paxillus involutus ATCC 200175]|uniref:Unplaced genomic scaffold PAXINscaffold_1765, whole genome shotgun sequence n=1 Tax=Paxillus involutus ATCC 200175 TaxID=664439 RepID=A0A0C9TAR2_PAXIN|nr:hypothetical protein PAXINDRAFT_21433 [Paxillus involutus ATCC 200175]
MIGSRLLHIIFSTTINHLRKVDFESCTQVTLDRFFIPRQGGEFTPAVPAYFTPYPARIPPLGPSRKVKHVSHVSRLPPPHHRMIVVLVFHHPEFD